jgi:hypothetical protein
MVGRRSVLALWFFLLLIIWNGSSPAFAATPNAEHPNIILITLDTTRADRMGFLGSKRGLTPNLDAVASKSVVFERTYSHVPLTTASHATLLTGTYSQFNRVIDFGIHFRRSCLIPTCQAERLSHRSVCWVCHPRSDELLPDSIAAEVYDAGFHLRRRGMDRYKTVEREQKMWLITRSAG